MQNKSADLAHESVKAMEAPRGEYDDIMLRWKTNTSDQQALQEESMLMYKQFNEEIEKLTVAKDYEGVVNKIKEQKEMREILAQKFKVLTDKGDEFSRLSTAASAKITQCSQAFTQASSDALIPLSKQIILESATREQRAPLMKRTWFATLTAP